MARDSELARDNYAAYSYARDNGHLEFIDKATTCDRFFRGHQWDKSIRAKLENLGKPVLTINKVLPTIAAIMGEQLAHRADVAFRASTGGKPEVAEVLDKLWLHTTNVNNFDWIESQMAAEAFIRSRGFIDLRADFSDQLRGEAKIRLHNAKNVLIDPDASAYDPDEWSEVTLTKWFTTRELDLTYGQGAAAELAAVGGAQFHHRYDTADWLPDTFGGENVYGGYDSFRDTERRRIHRVIERQYKEPRSVECFVSYDTGDMREIPDTWDRNRISYVMDRYGLGLYRKRINKIRWTTSADSVLLHDAISPYKHFTPIPFFPFFLHGMTIGIVENMISPQQLLNKASSQELHVVNTTANSGWKIKDQAIINMTPEELEERGAEDGLVLVMRDINGAEKITPNQIPTGLDRVSYKADDAIKEVSMVSDSMRGFDRADVAAKAIRAKQARGTVSLAKPLDNLDQTRRILVRNTLDLWQQFYTEERVIQMTGASMVEEPEQLVLNQIRASGEVVNDLTIGEYAAILSTVPAREDYEQTQLQEALEMRQAGVTIPDDVLIEHSHLNRKAEIAKRVRDMHGGGEPSEQELQQRQRMAELEMQAKEAETQENVASAQLKEANAALAAARAQTELIQARSGATDGEQKLLVEQQKLAIEREESAAKIQLMRMETLSDIQIKREKTEEELKLARTEQAAMLDLKRQESEAKQKQLAAPKPQPAQTKEQPNV